ncbi:MAG: bifunctional phosphoglucose/phosphomannose isomerase [Bacteroidota bacterium]
MDKLITAFTHNIDEAIAIAKTSKIHPANQEIKNIVICGMGGSGIGGKLVSQWIAGEIALPIALCQDYTLPHFVDQHTLVIGSSYSGNTEETLSALGIAREKGALIKCICSGGTLEQFCKDNNYDVIIVPGGNQPRAAIAYSLVQLLHIFRSMGMISGKSLEEMILGKEAIDANLEANKAEGKRIADFLYGKVGILYSEAAYEGVAVRARQQLNENSKFLGWTHAIPEMNHNELVGWGGGSDKFAVIFLRTEDMNPRNAARMDLTKEIISKKTPHIYELHAKGSSLIERSLHLINVMDWASYYLVDLNKVDVFDIKVINHLKDSLAKL